MQSQEKQWYLTNFDLFEKKLNGESTSPLHDIRKKAIAQVKESGFPTIRDEEWRFTNVNPIAKTEFKPAKDLEISQTSLKPYLLDHVTKHLLVFVNGKFSSQLSTLENLPTEITVKNLAAALKENQQLVEPILAKQADIKTNAFTALNTAFMQDGVFIHVPMNEIITEPIHILYISNAQSDSFVTHPRNLVIVESNAQASVIESYVGFGEKKYFTNPVLEISVGENAVLDHYKIQRETQNAYHVSVNNVYQERSSNYTSHSFSFGGALVRNDIDTVLNGHGVESVLNGLYIASHNQHVDNHTVIDHAKPHCHSNELYKGVLDNKAKAVFSGKIHVRQIAQKTDAVQSNQNLLLSEDATVDTKPQLEIFADDVKCTHGGTVGQIDEEGVFYLQSRGLSKDQARNMMIQAFAGEVTHKVKIESLRDTLDEWVFARLHDGHLE